jgi:tetrathionate reductase subunit A
MKEKKEKGLSRRDFMKCSAVLGGAVLASEMAWAQDFIRRAEAGLLTKEEEYELMKAENILYTSCLQCNTGCGIKVKLFRKNGNAFALRIDGNPYNPFVMVPHLPFKTPLADVASLDMPICPKGHAGLQTTYDPYRVVKVLKRAGKRGENKWTNIPFDQAIDEIVQGGNLFKHVPGEEDRFVTGLNDIYALRDPKIMKSMGDDAKAIAKSKDKKEAVAAFKRKHAANLQYLVDPDYPDAGPKNNQMIYAWGRKKAGRSEFALRFFRDYFGTANFHGHTTVCQGSLYFASKSCSDQYVNTTFSGGQKFYWQADIENSAYVLFVGSNLLDANYGPPNRGARLMPNITSGKIKIVVADPRFSKLASKAHKYLPVKPGTDGALFSAIIQWMLKNKRYDEKFLVNANKAAAKKAGEPTLTNAAWLVKISADGKAGKFLRAHEIGIADVEKRKDKAGKEFDFEYLVAMKDGKPVAVDPDDEKNAVFGDLFVNTEINGIKVKSPLQLISEEVNRMTPDQWAKLCGISKKDIEEVAKDLTSHGKKACVDVHRGVSQHTNGFYNVFLAWTINLLLGNYDWKGGMIAASTFSQSGAKESQPFNLSKINPGMVGNFGISIIRHDIRYEDTTYFQGYPAKRNWWPLASDIYQEIIPSMGDQYPYPAKAMFLYHGAPNFSLPAGQTNTEILLDLKKVPLYFCTDVLVGVTSLYADYIFPELNYLEKWEFQGSHPNMPTKVQPIRQPVIAPMSETVKVFGEETPCSIEAVLMALAERLGMKGYGKDGFGPGQDFIRPDDLYIRMVANIATDDGAAVPDADDKELKLFLDSRAHLPKTVFDPVRWEKICGKNWRKVVYILNRGGRFQDYKDQYKGDQVANKYGKLINIYQEKTAQTKNAFTGLQNPGYPLYVPIVTNLGKTPEKAGLTKGYDLHMITQKDVTQTKSRTIVDYWLNAIYPENSILVNQKDASKLKIKTGDKVRISSATNPDGVWIVGAGEKKPIIAHVQITPSIQPGVVTFVHGYGHWATGATDITIDGKQIKGDKRRGAGFNANAAMWTDPDMKNTCVMDPLGGSASFYDTMVRLTKVV